LEPVYRDDLKSDAADIANVGSDRNGGTIRGALFLREFVPESLPWAHVDIAGPSFTAKQWKYFAPGATGFGARLLAGLVKNLARPKGGCRPKKGGDETNPAKAGAREVDAAGHGGGSDL
jgi:leucyl aminopeptidase